MGHPGFGRVKGETRVEGVNVLLRFSVWAGPDTGASGEVGGRSETVVRRDVERLVRPMAEGLHVGPPDTVHYPRRHKLPSQTAPRGVAPLSSSLVPHIGPSGVVKADDEDSYAGRTKPLIWGRLVCRKVRRGGRWGRGRNRSPGFRPWWTSDTPTTPYLPWFETVGTGVVPDLVSDSSGRGRGRRRRRVGGRHPRGPWGGTLGRLGPVGVTGPAGR